MSILAGCVNNLIDITEIRTDIKTSVKRTAGIGIVQEQDAATITGQGTGGYGGPAVKAMETLPDGTQQEVTWEMVMGSSTSAKLPAGVKAKVLHDDRPGPNSREFERDLIRECTSYLDLPFEALFEMAGNTGPGIRYWMADIRRWVSIRHLYRARWCQTYYAIFMAKGNRRRSLAQAERQAPYLGRPGSGWQIRPSTTDVMATSASHSSTAVSRHGPMSGVSRVTSGSTRFGSVCAR